MVLTVSERPAELHGSHTGKGWVYVAIDDIDAHCQQAKTRRRWRVRERRAERLRAPRVTFPALTTEGKYGCP